MTARSIPIADWAASRYSPPPSMWTLRQWARNGELYPPPEKCGKHWYISEDAQRVTASGLTLVQRLRSA